MVNAFQVGYDLASPRRLHCSRRPQGCRSGATQGRGGSSSPRSFLAGPLASAAGGGGCWTGSATEAPAAFLWAVAGWLTAEQSKRAELTCLLRSEIDSHKNTPTVTADDVYAEISEAVMSFPDVTFSQVIDHAREGYGCCHEQLLKRFPRAKAVTGRSTTLPSFSSLPKGAQALRTRYADRPILGPARNPRGRGDARGHGAVCWSRSTDGLLRLAWPLSGVWPGMPVTAEGILDRPCRWSSGVYRTDRRRLGRKRPVPWLPWGRRQSPCWTTW
jgi:hypothetical protein